MPVVSNTSPILNLAIIDLLPLLQEQHEQVLIPPGVVEELRPNENLPESAAIQADSALALRADLVSYVMHKHHNKSSRLRPSADFLQIHRESARSPVFHRLQS